MTIDELATAAGTTTRHVRSLQTMGLLPHPALRARTGRYGPRHLDRLLGVLRLQDRGFSLRSLSVLFSAHDRGDSLASVLGLEPVEKAAGSGARSVADPAAVDEGDMAELYGFGAFEPGRRAGKPLLSVVPTTMWGEVPAAGVA